MIISIIKKADSKYYWLIDKEIVSPETGLETIEEAIEWYKESKYYMDSHYFSNPKDNNRWRTIPRRSGKDRRDRHSMWERRHIHIGRRWTDKLDYMKGHK